MRLAILGGGGHGHVIADAALAAGWNDCSLFDNRQPAIAPLWPIAGTAEDLAERLADYDGVVVGLGGNDDRLAWHKRLVDLGGRLVTIVHPRASVSPHATLGAGTVVFAGAVVNIRAQIGQAVIVNTGASVDHDCALDDGVHISPGARLAGGVQVGEATWIGIGAAVREGIKIGKGVRIGAGAVIVKDVPDGVTLVGNPGRLLG